MNQFLALALVRIARDLKEYKAQLPSMDLSKPEYQTAMIRYELNEAIRRAVYVFQSIRVLIQQSKQWVKSGEMAEEPRLQEELRAAARLWQKKYSPLAQAIETARTEDFEPQLASFFTKSVEDAEKVAQWKTQPPAPQAQPATPAPVPSAAPAAAVEEITPAEFSKSEDALPELPGTPADLVDDTDFDIRMLPPDEPIATDELDADGLDAALDKYL
ncbi:hypothetical protein [Calycomorphotria hydatis]|uniref:Uncharacterized protein n=1 Tax=Calycomorphotria hydatis TaxID=2528027 RepID=A0A517TFC9_9PLAN|nr:hypothetical protein [Calycomorphotria hydatis]QDT67080.1 hypothetical protein V22_43530 [Calycomorphotria hydatis]